MAYDLVVKDALIVDGTGKAAYAGDVAVENGTIAAVGKVDGAAVRTIEADGQVVAPGFIDAHTHYDAQLLWDPSANPSTAHGVTSVLMGNCGYTLAPVHEDDQDYLMGLFRRGRRDSESGSAEIRPVQLADLPRLPGMAAAEPARIERPVAGGTQRGAPLRDGR